MKNQSGSALLLLLVAVALFASLSYAFMKGAGNSTTMLTDEQAKTYATQIIAYGNDVKMAVKRLQMRGCTETQISFETPAVPDYVNLNAPADKTCHIFDTKGAGLQHVSPPPPFATPGANYSNGRYSFVKGTLWHGNGADCANASCTELLMMLSMGPNYANVCDKINELLGYTKRPIENHNFGGAAFNGVYDHFPTTYVIGDEADSIHVRGKTAACFQRVNATNPYLYAVVLIPR